MAPYRQPGGDAQAVEDGGQATAGELSMVGGPAPRQPKKVAQRRSVESSPPSGWRRPEADTMNAGRRRCSGRLADQTTSRGAMAMSGNVWKEEGIGGRGGWTHSDVTAESRDNADGLATSRCQGRGQSARPRQSSAPRRGWSEHFRRRLQQNSRKGTRARQFQRHGADPSNARRPRGGEPSAQRTPVTAAPRAEAHCSA